MPEQRPLLTDGERYTTRIEPLQRGGGEKHHPQTEAEARERLLPQAQTLRREATAIPSELRGPRLIFFATMLPNYLANTYFPSQLIRELDLVPLGSRKASGTLRTRTRTTEGAPAKTLVLAGTDQSLAQLVQLLEQTDAPQSRRQARADLRQFEQIRLPVPGDIESGFGRQEGAEDLLLMEAVLHPDAEGPSFRRRPLDEPTYLKWERLVTLHHGTVASDYRRTVGGLTFVPILLPPTEVDEVSKFNPLRSIRPMPQLRPLPEVLRGAGVRMAPHPDGIRPDRSRPVAVFDGGVDVGSRYYGPFTTLSDLTGLPSQPRLERHGTLVTSALLYGHLPDGASLPRPAAAVHHYRVFPLRDPARDPDLYNLLDQIVANVRAGGHDIVNLSLGPNESVEEDAEPSRWTAELDELAYEREVLFVVAVGNNGLEDQATGLNRVQLPGDMVNCLAIGACDGPRPDQPLRRTPYSAVGPGRPGGRIRPTAVAFGGIDDDPFRGVAADGSPLEWSGTSFSAPAVTGSVARLSSVLSARSSPCTLRAFAAHFATPPDRGQDMEVGHGRVPMDFEPYLESDRNQVHVLFRGTAERGRVDRLLLPYPEDVERKGLVSIRWTLAYASPTDPTEAVEYTKAGLDILFRPNIHIRTVTLAGRTSTVDTRTDLGSIRDSLAQGGSLSQHPKTEAGGGGAEGGRREDGKWETVRRQHVRMRAGRLQRPTLDIIYYAREGGVLVTDASSIAYALLVTVETARDVDLYGPVRKEFPLLVPLRVEARPQVRLSAR
jgi:Subtilase family